MNVLLVPPSRFTDGVKPAIRNNLNGRLERRTKNRRRKTPYTSTITPYCLLLGTKNAASNINTPANNRP